MEARPRIPARIRLMGSPLVIPEAPAAAVIGGGFIGAVHVEALRRIGVEVVGLLGSSPERSSGVAARLGIPRVYRDLDELLGDARVGVVHVASPNRHHFEQARRALESGRHVICEKPLAITSAETSALRPGRVAAIAGGGGQLQHPLLSPLPRDPRADRRRGAGASLECHRIVRPGLAALSGRLQLARRGGRRDEPAHRGRHRHALDGPGAVLDRRADPVRQR